MHLLYLLFAVAVCVRTAVDNDLAVSVGTRQLIDRDLVAVAEHIHRALALPAASRAWYGC